MKKSKKLVAFFLALAMMVSLLAGCGGDQPSGSSQPPSDTAQPSGEQPGNEQAGNSSDTPEQSYKIGYNVYASASFIFQTLTGFTSYVCDTLGYETQVVDDETKRDKILNDIENLIASDVDGIVVWAQTDNLFLAIADACEEAQVYWTIADQVPSDAATKEKLLTEYKYFAGAVTNTQADFGRGSAEYCLEHGFKNALVTCPNIGSATDTPRWETFTEVFTAGGGKVVDELHSSDIETATANAQNALLAHADTDIIYATGSDFGVGAINALSSMGNSDLKVITHGFDPSIMSSPYVEMISGDQWMSGLFAAVLLMNAVEGNMLTDENGHALWISDAPMYSVSPDQFPLYEKFFIDQKAYTPEEIKNMTVSRNPDFTAEDFIEIVHSYSLEERLNARLVEGAVTAEELESVGLKVY